MSEIENNNTTTEATNNRSSTSNAWSGLVTMTIVCLVHLACLAIFWTGVSWASFITCILLYKIRGFGITGVYHRYFSHKAYKTSRTFQFILALLGASALQGTPLEWAKNHRHHHRHSDQEKDIHSPRASGFWWSHIGWMFTLKGHPVSQKVRDLEQFPELKAIAWLQIIIIGALIVGIYQFGEYLGAAYNTNGLQMLIWGFFMSTIILWHATYSINSLTHMWGTRRYETTDDSRNSFILGIFCLGEGWHNNHHKYPSAARNGFFWWEIDLTYYILKVLSWCHLIWDLTPPPAEAYNNK